MKLADILFCEKAGIRRGETYVLKALKFDPRQLIYARAIKEWTRSSTEALIQQIAEYEND